MRGNRKFDPLQGGSLYGQKKASRIKFLQKESIMEESSGRLGKIVSREITLKLKKQFLKNKVAKAQAKGVAKGKNGKKNIEAELGEKDMSHGDGPLKGKLCRVVDEKSPYCGHLIEVKGHVAGKVHGHVAWKDVNDNFLEKNKMSAQSCPRCHSCPSTGFDSASKVNSSKAIAVQR